MFHGCCRKEFLLGEISTHRKTLQLVLVKLGLVPELPQPTSLVHWQELQYPSIPRKELSVEAIVLPPRKQPEQGYGRAVAQAMVLPQSMQTSDVLALLTATFLQDVLACS